jgi:hypothetical protein
VSSLIRPETLENLRRFKQAAEARERGEVYCAKPPAPESRLVNLAFAALWLFMIVAGVISMCSTLDGRISLGLILAGLIGYFWGKGARD